MKVALAQLNSKNEISHNLQMVSRLVESAVNDRPEIIFFPENSLFFRLNSAAEMQPLQLEDDVLQSLAQLSDRTKIALHLTTAIKEGGSVFNASILVQPGRQTEVLYRKIHLFDIALKDQTPIRESDVFAYGRERNIFEFGGFRFGSSICYDIRFSELYSQYAKNKVDAILVPSAFLVKTGQAHWDVLLRARAIESQCYVLAPAQSGRHVGADENQFRETYGHSMVIDPWGKVLSMLPSGVGLIYAELQKSEIESVRQQIPMKDHRRL